MVGSALTSRLSSEKCEILTTGERRLDLTRQDKTEAFISSLQREAVIMGAARLFPTRGSRDAPGKIRP
jgi:dTDP-4-dehydrorhamnose reductase